MSNSDLFISTFDQWIKVFMRRSTRNFIRFAKESGLSMSQMGALFHLHHRGSCGVTNIGEHLGVTNAATSQLLDRLVQQDLIHRTEDLKDRRFKQIALTEEGSQVIEDGIRSRQGWLNDLGDILSDSEKEQIILALNIMIEKANLLNQPIEPEI